MIDQQFCIHSKKPIKKSFIIKIFRGSHGTPRNISHRIQAFRSQFLRITGADAPKIRDRLMRPQQLTIRDLIQTGDPHPILIRNDMFCQNIHCDLTQIHIRSNPRRCCDPGVLQYILDHLLCKLSRCLLIRFQIMCYIHKNFINGIYMYIFRGYIF